MNPALAKASRTVHWVSSAVGLASLVFFSITGITLNHPDWFSAQRSVYSEAVTLSPDWLARFQVADEVARLGALSGELQRRWQLDVPRNIDRDEFEWVLDYQRPGGLTTVVLDIETGDLSLERVDDGMIALINDLHKGRHSGTAWMYLIDVVSVTCLLFAVTGLLLLFVHAGKRRSTWPLVGLGTVLPLALYWVFVP